jgi:hypothetical protein
MYASFYNDKGHMMGINGRGRKGWRPLQSGLKQHLFCEECEQHFNEYCEKPFKRSWVDTNPLPPCWPDQEPVCIQVDYASFKLFHLSVLFRASVTTLPTFSAVALGRHQESIRQMLIKHAAGPSWQYPIMGIALYDRRSRSPVQLVTAPVAARLGGLHCYGMAYGGVQWWIAVSSQRSSDWDSASLTNIGQLQLAGMPWTELGVVRQASSLIGSAGG